MRAMLASIQTRALFTLLTIHFVALGEDVAPQPPLPRIDRASDATSLVSARDSADNSTFAQRSEPTAAGATSPDDEAIPDGPQQHWAWQTPKRTPLPNSSDPAGDTWSENPIDAFVYAKLMEHRIEPLPLADRRTRLRRLYLDLIGLPPTPGEQRAFLQETSADAWPDVVNRLLADPAHGERWARHWMDVWRYSDWDGYQDELRGSQRHIWRWRDWIIESLNADKGYDQMVVEMLAGDEVAPTDPHVLRATGFLARNYHSSNRNIWLDATVEHTAKAFLAMTINCARCHEHKYDPISQREYYAFRAIFEPHHVRTERLPGQPDIQQDGLARVYDAQLDESTFLLVAGNEKMPDKDHPVLPAAPSLLGVPLDITPLELPVEAVFPALREFVEQEDIAAAESKLTTAKEAFSKISDQSQGTAHELEISRQTVVAAEADLASLRARWAADNARFANHPDELAIDESRQAAVNVEHLAKTENAKLTLLEKQQALEAAECSDEKQGDEKLSAIEMARKDLEAAEKNLDALAESPDDGAEYTSVGQSYPATSSGRRLALARWIVRLENPLTARVAVNYVWMHHFGEPLVSNVFDFGLRTPEPPHRALLDWLAVELIEHDWSLKHLHRRITTSRTYQLASSRQDNRRWASNGRVDPDNRLLWRANVRRLDAEVIRDSLLCVAENLDRAQGGPDIDIEKGDTIPRRSLYFRHAYEKQMTLLVLFDAAAPTECYRRSPSIIPQQALALANGPLALDQARSLAAQLTSQAGDAAGSEEQQCDDAAFVRAAFEALLCRDCSASELQTCTEFLKKQSALLASDGQLTPLPGQSRSQTEPAQEAAQRARENLIHTLMNHNDFVTVR